MNAAPHEYELVAMTVCIRSQQNSGSRKNGGHSGRLSEPKQNHSDSASQADSAPMIRLRKDTSMFLERDQDRPLFDLAPAKKEE